MKKNLVVLWTFPWNKSARSASIREWGAAVCLRRNTMTRTIAMSDCKFAIFWRIQKGTTELVSDMLYSVNTILGKKSSGKKITRKLLWSFNSAEHLKPAASYPVGKFLRTDLFLSTLLAASHTTPTQPSVNTVLFGAMCTRGLPSTKSQLLGNPSKAWLYCKNNILSEGLLLFSALEAHSAQNVRVRVLGLRPPVHLPSQIC